MPRCHLTIEHPTSLLPGSLSVLRWTGKPAKSQVPTLVPLHVGVSQVHKAFGGQTDMVTAACIGVSPSLASWQLQTAREVAGHIGIPLWEVCLVMLFAVRFSARGGRESTSATVCSWWAQGLVL